LNLNVESEIIQFLDYFLMLIDKCTLTVNGEILTMHIE